MKNIYCKMICMICMIGMVACSASELQKSKTDEAQALLTTLKTVSQKNHFLFGHHDDPVYGIGWIGDKNRSDVKSVCGDYPAIMSFDLGRIELGGDKNLDNVPIERLRHEIIAQYERGGMVSLSWHADNPVTGKDAWDVSDSTVVASVLPGGTQHDKFMGWLDTVADFMNSLIASDGRKVPVLFRPWHEHTGSWFWWGQALCSATEYKALWHMTYEFMQQKGVKHLLYAYSPGTEPNNTAEYLDRYPGDDIINLIGFDTYQFNRQEYLNSMEKSLTILTEVGQSHDKPIAITETGYEAVPDSTWWTETLLPIISKYPISYVLVWRNAYERPNHYYAPYPGQASASDFVKFYADPRTLFVRDMKTKK
ncbi:glycoside hydrolase family 26 protein [Phocaeicola dorei]|uniref:glycoside hydrolase family 26 protein n=1 Tax=Phocaeicola dorei TaxID=357276 RepID=UPI00234E1C0F|nr:glycosyl hydrolase [Phocaeicola dorei]MDC7171048.1 glycosyl hydrolase [Phocaeicola dorei]